MPRKASKPATDTARVVAFDSRAPQSERTEALTELQKAHAPKSMADLLPPENVMRVIRHIQSELAEQDMLQKANGAQIIQYPGAAERQRRRGMKSVYLDDLQVTVLGDYYEKPGAIQFEAMRSMVEQVPILNAIIMTRIRQVQRFCSPLEQRDGPGFQIRHVDLKHKVTPEETQQMQMLSRFFTNCGWEFNPRARKRLRRDNFLQFMSKHVRDSLIMDSAPIETEYKRDRRRGIDGFYAVDGSTIRLCTESGYQGDDNVYALQVVQGRVRTAYTYDDLIYEPRNPRTEVAMAGYGLSETELLVRVVTGLLNAMTLNIKGFSENAIPRGILHLVGDFTQEDLDAFRRYWNGMVRGVNNAWALPVMAASDPDSKASFEKIDAGFNEMYFSKWMTFLTSIACAVYQMAPDEINFESFTNGSSSLGGEDKVEKIAASKDKGLRPLLSTLEAEMSDFICSDFSSNFVFRWSGLDEDDADQNHELRKLLGTFDELRAEEGREPIGGELGQAPVNPALLSTWQAMRQEKLQQQQQAEQGDFGDDPDEAGGDGDSGAPAGASPDDDGKGFAKAFPVLHRIGWG
ncbi:phage portal protein [Nevskia sp.]|uniref:phage portal protein n=1 Tax=Nevskia sp. TaxID=1929292 RepID=UPI002600E295|nr:phage portal protein [Nevskia sp.]